MATYLNFKKKFLDFFIFNFESDPHRNSENRRNKQGKEKLDDRSNTRPRNYSERRSRSLSSNENSLSRSRNNSIGREYYPVRSRSGSRDKNNITKRTERRESSVPKNPLNTKKSDVNVSVDNKINGEEVKMKKFNFLMCLPKNYYRFIEKDFVNLSRDVNKFFKKLF